eukprot:scaffold14636_cov79-Isochrysis_galbana.AAC.1
MRREEKRRVGAMFLLRYLRSLLRHYEEGFWLVLLAILNSVPGARALGRRLGILSLAESRAASMVRHPRSFLFSLLFSLLFSRSGVWHSPARFLSRSWFGRDWGFYVGGRNAPALLFSLLGSDTPQPFRASLFRGEGPFPAFSGLLPSPRSTPAHPQAMCGNFRAHDVALSLLRMVANNIGHVSTLSAQQVGAVY